MEALDAFTGPLLAAVAVLIVEFISWGRFRDLKRRISSLEAGQRGLEAGQRNLEAAQHELRAEVVTRTDAVEKNLRDELGGRIDKLGRDLGARIDKLGNELAVMRSDLTHVALAVGAREEPNAG